MALINPQAIALTRTNAYNAAKVILGMSAPATQLIQVANAYTKYIIPRTNRALTVQEILGDIQLGLIVSNVKDQTDNTFANKVAKEEKIVANSVGLTDSPLGVPNWIVIGGLGIGAYLWYRHKKKIGPLFGGKAAATTPAEAVPKG